jgi:hypothetical protein
MKSQMSKDKSQADPATVDSNSWGSKYKHLKNLRVKYPSAMG